MHSTVGCKDAFAHRYSVIVIILLTVVFMHSTPGRNFSTVGCKDAFAYRYSVIVINTLWVVKMHSTLGCKVFYRRV